MKGIQLTKNWSSEIETKGVNPLVVLELHRDIGEVLAHVVDDQERENVKLKKKVDELGPLAPSLCSFNNCLSQNLVISRVISPVIF